MARKPVPMRLTAAVAQIRIRAAAADSSHVGLTQHARDRMLERGIDITDVLRILRRGFVDVAPILNDRGNWQCEVALQLIGRRTAACITVILNDERLKVRTVMWRDGS